MSWMEQNIHQNDLEAVCCDKSAWICLLKSYIIWEGIRHLSAMSHSTRLGKDFWKVKAFRLQYKTYIFRETI